MALARADFLERVRRYSFFITLVACVYAANGFLPPNHSSYATLQLQGHRGIYNSAWVGTVVALLTSLFLSLVGFYLVKNAVDRDRQTGVGQILAATPLSRLDYVVGKVLSNFAVLAVMTCVVALAAAAVQRLRAEETAIHPWPLAAPFLFLTLPVMLAVAAVAVLFEVIPFLRGGGGNVAYFFVWLVALSLGGLAVNSGTSIRNDFLGMGQVLPRILSACHDAFPDYDPGAGNMSLGLEFKESGMWNLATFRWEGIDWTAGVIAERAVWILAPLLITLSAAACFDRFDPKRLAGRDARRRPRSSRSADAEASAPEDLLAPGVSGRATGLTPLPVATGPGGKSLRFARILRAELRLMTAGLSRWWYLVLAGMMVAAVLTPLEVARTHVLPLLWIWPALIWSPMGSRERRHGTDSVLFSAPHPVQLQLGASWLAGVIIALGAAVPIGARLMAAGGPAAAFPWGIGALFIPALALALGVWTGTSRFFEAFYTGLWYIGPLQGMPQLDFMGASPEWQTGGVPIFYLASTVVLLALSAAGRLRQIRN